MKKTISIILAAAMASAAVMMSACGEKKAETTAESSVEAESSVSQPEKKQESSKELLEVSSDDAVAKLTSNQLTEINNKIAGYQNVPEWKFDATPFNVLEASDGKKVALITKNSTNSYFSLYEHNFDSAAKTAGLKNVVFTETDGSTSTINDALAKAVEEKADVAILEGDINKDDVSSYIENTQANGIEIFSSGSKTTGEKDHYVDYTIPINYNIIGELMADWGIVKTNGSLNALAVYCTDSELSETLFKGFKSEFEKYVSSSNGYCTTINTSSLEIGNGLSNKIKKAIDDDSNINYIFIFDDSAISDAITATSVSTGVKIVTTGGTKEAFDAAQSGSVEMLVAQSYEWSSYAVVDYVLRILSGTDLPKEQYVPVRVVTKDSIEKALNEYDGDYDGFYEICFGAAFIDGYTEMWNLDE